MRSLRWMPFKGSELPTRRGDPRAFASPFDEMRREFDRMFDDAFRSFWPSIAGEATRPERYLPSIDVADEKKHVRVTAEFPGMEKSDLQLSVFGDRLILRGEKKTEEVAEDEGYYRAERSYGTFERTIPLPVEVDSERAEATFKNGVLTVRLPKLHGEGPKRQIEIKGG